MPEEWQPKKKLDVVKRADPKLVRQVSRRTNLGVALRMSRRNFWLHFYHPLLTFLECERVYYSMYYVPRADSDVLSQKYHLALEGLQMIVDALDSVNLGAGQKGSSAAKSTSSPATATNDTTTAGSRPAGHYREPGRGSHEAAPAFSLNHGGATGGTFGSFSSWPSPSLAGTSTPTPPVVPSPSQISSAVESFLSSPLLTPSSFVSLVRDLAYIVRTRCGMITALKRLKRSDIPAAPHSDCVPPSSSSGGARQQSRWRRGSGAVPTSSRDWARATRSLLRKPTTVSHPLLIGVRAHTIHEVNILSCCMQAQDAIENGQFRDSVVALHQARHALGQWRNMFSSPDGAGVTFSAGASAITPLEHTPPMLQWLTLFYHTLRAKSSLYFWGLIHTTELKRMPKATASPAGTPADALADNMIVGGEDLMKIFRGIVSAGRERGFRSVVALLLTTDGEGGKLSHGREYCSDYGYSVATSLLRLQEKRRRDQEELDRRQEAQRQASAREGLRPAAAKKPPPLLTPALRKLLSDRAAVRRQQFQGILSSPVLFTFPPTSAEALAEAKSRSKALAKRQVLEVGAEDGEVSTLLPSVAGTAAAASAHKDSPLSFLQPHLPNVVAMAMMLRATAAAAEFKSTSNSREDGDRDGDTSVPLHIFSPPPRRMVSTDGECDGRNGTAFMGGDDKQDGARNNLLAVSKIQRQGAAAEHATPSTTFHAHKTTTVVSGASADTDNPAVDVIAADSALGEQGAPAAACIPVLSSRDAPRTLEDLVLTGDLGASGTGPRKCPYGIHYYACRVDSRVTLVVVEAPIENSLEQRNSADGASSAGSVPSGVGFVERKQSRSGVVAAGSLHLPARVSNRDLPSQTRQTTDLQRHSDLAASRNLSAARTGPFMSSPMLRDRFVSAPATPSSVSVSAESDASEATAPPRFPRYGTGSSIWYSQSQSRRRRAAAGDAEERELEKSEERERAAMVSPGARVMELTAQLARVLQNKCLTESLGPVKGYLGSDVSSVGRVDGGPDNDRRMLDHAERTEARGCITC